MLNSSPRGPRGTDVRATAMTESKYAVACASCVAAAGLTAGRARIHPSNAAQPSTTAPARTTKRRALFIGMSYTHSETACRTRRAHCMSDDGDAGSPLAQMDPEHV